MKAKKKAPRRMTQGEKRLRAVMAQTFKELEELAREIRSAAYEVGFAEENGRHAGEQARSSLVAAHVEQLVAERLAQAEPRTYQTVNIGGGAVRTDAVHGAADFCNGLADTILADTIGRPNS